MPAPRGGPSVEDWFPALSRRRDGPWLAHRLDRGHRRVPGRRAAPRRAPRRAGRVPQRPGAQDLLGRRARRPGGGVGGRVDCGARPSGPAPGRLAHGGGPGGAALQSRTGPVRGRGPGMAWLELHPRTGRTHQIRVHCALARLPGVRGPGLWRRTWPAAPAGPRHHPAAGPAAGARTAPPPRHMAAGAPLVRLQAVTIASTVRASARPPRRQAHVEHPGELAAIQPGIRRSPGRGRPVGGGDRRSPSAWDGRAVPPPRTSPPPGRARWCCRCRRLWNTPAYSAPPARLDPASDCSGSRPRGRPHWSGSPAGRPRPSARWYCCAAPSMVRTKFLPAAA